VSQTVLQDRKKDIQIQILSRIPNTLATSFTVFVRNYGRFALGEKEAKSLILMIMTEKG
jgi:hypothetical protein